MDDLRYSFELTAADYRFASLHAYGGTNAYAQALAPRVFVAFLLALLFLGYVLGDDTGRAVVTAIAVAILYGLFLLAWWKWRFNAESDAYYTTEPYKRLLGPHELVISQDGIRSVGPFHESFRRWGAVTHVCFTASHVLFHTIYGNVYLLPNAAVGNRDELRQRIAANVPVQNA